MRLKHLIQRLAILCILVAVLGLGGVMLVQYVDTWTGPFRYSNPTDLPDVRVAIIFGASISRNGELSPVLKDRVDMGIDLYRKGKVKKLLMSGDNRTDDYNEVAAMKRYTLAQGIPEGDITLDYAGFSTYETCYRAKEIFGVVDKTILISQRYHIPRAVYSCRKLGLDAVGIEIPDWERYPTLRERSLLREELATVKMLWSVHVTKPKPTFLGSFEGIQ